MGLHDRLDALSQASKALGNPTDAAPENTGRAADSAIEGDDQAVVELVALIAASVVAFPGGQGTDKRRLRAFGSEADDRCRLDGLGQLTVITEWLDGSQEPIPHRRTDTSGRATHEFSYHSFTAPAALSLVGPSRNVGEGRIA